MEKNTKIEIRISENQKEKLIQYTKKHNITISELIRIYINQLIEGE